MQETRINKVSRRFYIDHADDHAVVRAVPVAVELKPRQDPRPVPAVQPVAPQAPRLRGKLAAVKLPHRKHA